MERDSIPLGLLWEETCQSTLAAIGQLATQVDALIEPSRCQVSNLTQSRLYV
jgi:hypothetical protein